MFGATDQNLSDLLAKIPDELPVLPLRNMVAFPFTVLPITRGVPRSQKLVQDAMHGNRMVVLVTSHDPEIDEPTPNRFTRLAVSRSFNGPLRVKRTAFSWSFTFWNE